MKYTFAVACLISTSQAYLGEKVWGLKSTKGRAYEALVQAEYGKYSVTAANSRPPYSSSDDIEIQPEGKTPSKNDKSEKEVSVPLPTAEAPAADDGEAQLLQVSKRHHKKKHHHKKAKKLVQMSDSETESSDEENLMTEIDGEPKYYTAGDHGELGADAYERVIPPRFSADSDDIFMRSMI